MQAQAAEVVRAGVREQSDEEVVVESGGEEAGSGEREGGGAVPRALPGVKHVDLRRGGEGGEGERWSRRRREGGRGTET